MFFDRRFDVFPLLCHHSTITMMGRSRVPVVLACSLAPALVECFKTPAQQEELAARCLMPHRRALPKTVKPKICPAGGLPLLCWRLLLFLQLYKATRSAPCSTPRPHNKANLCWRMAADLKKSAAQGSQIIAIHNAAKPPRVVSSEAERPSCVAMAKPTNYTIPQWPSMAPQMRLRAAAPLRG